MNMTHKRRGQKGFTLVEMLIVVAIIAILIAIAIPIYSAQMDKAKEAVDNANARTAESLAVADYMLRADTDGETYYFGYDADTHTLTASTDTNLADPVQPQASANAGTELQVTIAADGSITAAGWQ